MNSDSVSPHLLASVNSGSVSPELIASFGGLLAAIGALITGVLATRSKVKLDDIAKLHAKIDQLEQDLEQEKAARDRDATRLEPATHGPSPTTRPNWLTSKSGYVSEIRRSPTWTGLFWRCAHSLPGCVASSSTTR
ncbi:LapA family protein [Williamsia sp. D3]|uniref:LapA family protein n=1 Tax=Williamsia sp. D3 TaxID=1313067 RepID=UPI0003D39CB6|nr:LapA family protein [Williamsia sp. D3]ETD31534.1 hypothetical protein W823_19335 [Williamsia sp. D3]